MSASTSGTGPILYHTLGSRLGIVQVAEFVQSLEFLQKVLKFPSNFLDLEKVWKIERKSGKMVKSLQFYNKCYYTIMLGKKIAANVGIRSCALPVYIYEPHGVN